MRLKEVSAWADARIAEGHDGAVLTYPDGTSEIAMFDPARVQSVFAAFDPDQAGSNELKASIPERTDMVDLGGNDPTWRGKMADAFDVWRTRMQDRYLPLLKVQRDIERATGALLPEGLNPYLGEELMSGRIGARLEALT